VLVGIPSIRDDDRFRDYRETVIKGIIETIPNDVDYEVFVTPPQHKRSWEGVVDACNLLVEKTLREGWDYLWLVEGDVQVPPDAFEKLYGLDVDVAQGFVPYHHDFNSIIAGFLDENMKIWYLPRNAIKDSILSGWVFAGLSCTLIKRRVFENELIRFKHKPWTGHGHDVIFMFEVQKAGFVAKIHGGVECGHLPEWPLRKPMTLDVGCGNEPKGDVNVDLFPEATPHRSADQRVCDDKPLNVKLIKNFVKADACHLPFKDRVFSRVYSGHTIEHVKNPQGMIRELLRVSYSEIEIVCPRADSPYGISERKPLHINALSPKWFQDVLSRLPEIEFNISCKNYEIFAKIYRQGYGR